MKINIFWIWLLSGFWLFQMPSTYAEESEVINKNAIEVEFKLACANNIESCMKAVVVDTKEELYVQKVPVITLVEIASAEARSDEVPEYIKDVFEKINGAGEPESVTLEIKLDSNGREKFDQITSQNIGKRMAIFIDGDLMIAPEIHEAISSGEVAVTYPSFEKAKSIAERINYSKSISK